MSSVAKKKAKSSLFADKERKLGKLEGRGTLRFSTLVFQTLNKNLLSIINAALSLKSIRPLVSIFSIQSGVIYVNIVSRKMSEHLIL